MNFKRILSLSGLLCFALYCISAQQNIYVNQVGYTPTSTKIFYTDYPSESFDLIDVVNKNIVYSGDIRLKVKNDANSDITLYQGDFSAFKKKGTYLIKVHSSLNSGINSYPFKIEDGVYAELISLANQSLFLQRCGLNLDEKYAGIHARQACHLEKAKYHHTCELDGYKNMTGGWHDAGDYGKYVAPGSITAAILLLTKDLNLTTFSGDDWQIPESGNGVPDVLDEVKYELDWILKMQRADGAVHEKVHTLDYAPFMMPSESKIQQYIYEVSSTATADFAAIMARASQAYKGVNPSFARECLNVSKKAYKYLSKHTEIFPSGGFKNPEDTKAGGYYDANDKDERLWAAVELYLATGEERFHEDFLKMYRSQQYNFSVLSWNNPTSMAFYRYVLSPSHKQNAAVGKAIQEQITSYCNKQIEIAAQDGFGVAMTENDFIWGSNGHMLNKAMTLIVGYKLTQNRAYIEVANRHLDYILGINPNKISYVTGIGTKRILHLHHAPSIADVHAEPIPGILTGGPNRMLQDGALANTFSKDVPPAKAFIDDVESYSSNENTIYANASLVFVAAYLNRFNFGD